MYALRNLGGKKIIDETRTVYIKKTDDGYQLIRNGEPFFIQGAAGNSHLEELSLINGNTLRIYDTLNLSEILDEAEKYGLAVIVDISIPEYNKKYDCYSDKENNELIKQKVRVLINKYKGHPALLMWNLGNELLHPLVLRKNSFIKTFNELIDIIHSEDPNHPVSTAIGGVSRKAMASLSIHSPEIDLLSFNTFGGTKFIYSNLNQISFLFGGKPYYLSEIGSDGPWETRYTSWGAPIEPTSSKKAEHYRARYNQITENNDGAYLGSLVFYWGNKLERTFTWYSLFLDDYKSEIIREIEDIWQKSNNNSPFIGLDYMLVDGKGAYDNIIYSPDELKTAKIVCSDSINDCFGIKWEIYPEVWIEDTSKMILNPKKPIDSFVGFEKNTATFITPNIEGAYRIFAYVFDQDGYFATTNTPFYVLANK